MTTSPVQWKELLLHGRIYNNVDSVHHHICLHVVRYTNIDHMTLFPNPIHTLMDFHYHGNGPGAACVTLKYSAALKLSPTRTCRVHDQTLAISAHCASHNVHRTPIIYTAEERAVDRPDERMCDIPLFFITTVNSGIVGGGGGGGFGSTETPAKL